MPRSGDSSVWTELETISVLRTAALHLPAWTKSISAANEICKRRRQLGPLEKSPRKSKDNTRETILTPVFHIRGEMSLIGKAALNLLLI